MFISRRGPNRQYAYITTSYREDGRVKTKDEYLGRIVDYDKGIFKSKDRGVFTFDMSTGEYGVPESSYVPNEIEDRRKREHDASGPSLNHSTSAIVPGSKPETRHSHGRVPDPSW